MGIAFLFVLFTALYGYWQNNRIEVEQIDVKITDLPRGLAGFRIAHISDTHIPRNVSTRKNIIALLREQNPDLIVLTGDILNKRSRIDTELAGIFCRDLCAVAPAYAVSGNHEAGLRLNWKRVLQHAGVTVLDDRMEIFGQDNAALAILGLRDGREYKEGLFGNLDSAKGLPRLLLAHRPELFYSYRSNSNTIKPDLVFCGHAHGGQFRIPLLNLGIFAPHQGLFPRFTSGVYSAGGSKWLSAGVLETVFSRCA